MALLFLKKDGRVGALKPAVFFLLFAVAAYGYAGAGEVGGFFPGVSFNAEFAGSPSLGGSKASFTEYSTRFGSRFFSLELSGRRYDLGGGEAPWGDLRLAKAGSGYYRALAGGHSLLAIFSVASGFEDDFSSGAVSFRLQPMWIYEADSGRAFYLGFGLTRRKVRPSLHPVAGVSGEGGWFSWMIGYPSDIEYEFNENFSASFFLLPDTRVYGLSGQGARYLRTHDWKAGLGAEYSPRKGVAFTVGLARNFERSIRLYDGDGGEISSQGAPGAWSIMIGADFAF